MKMQTITKTRRFCKANATSRSIIEEHSALHDHAVTNLETALDHDLTASLEAGFHRNRFEGPGRDLGEYPIGVVLEYQSRCRNQGNRIWNVLDISAACCGVKENRFYPHGVEARGWGMGWRHLRRVL